MPQVDIQLIHKACQDYLNDPILKPFAEVDLTEQQSSMDLLLGKAQKENIIPEVSVVHEKKKIVQEILQTSSVLQVDDILDRHDHGALTNREFLQTTNSAYLSWIFLRLQVNILVQNLKNSRYLPFLWLALPTTTIAINGGIGLYLGIAVVAMLVYALLRAAYAVFQIYQASCAFEIRSQKLITELDTSVVQDYNVASITEILPQFDLVYDADGNWLDSIIESPGQWQDKISADGSPLLYTVLTCQNPNYSLAIIKKLQQVVSLLSAQKYIRNDKNETPMYVLNRSDIYGFKHLLDVYDVHLFQDQFNKIDRFLTSVRTQRKKTKALLLLEGVSGTGKSQTVMEYIGKNKQFKVHRWEAGEKGDAFVGGLEGRARGFFADIMKQARENPHAQYAIYLDNIDVICGTKGKDTKEWIKALAGQFCYYIDKIRQESTNIIVIGTTQSALDMDVSLLDHSARVRFPLPTEEQRHSLLQHAFIETLVSSRQIQQLVQATEGWSHRALVSIASNLDKETVVTDQKMEEALERIRGNLEFDFTKMYPHTQIILPKFLKTNAFLNYRIVTPPSIAECLKKLSKYLCHPECYDRTPMHTLMYGPPGGGKTTAIRNFCEEMNLPFIVIKSGISASDLSRALESVNEFKYALVFIDEIDSFPHTGELLKQMDGFAANNTILIGATNKPAQVIAAGEGALGDRFHFKVYVPGLTAEQRAIFIKWKVAEQLERTGGLLQAAPDLAEQISASFECLELATQSQTLSMRSLANHINSFFGERRYDAQYGSSEAQTVTVALDDFATELKQVSENQIIKTY